MTIRKAKKTDLKEIGKLMKEEFSKKPFNERDSMNAILKSLDFYYKTAKIYVADFEKEIAGVLVFQIEQWWEGQVIIIQDLAVKSKFKKQGIGKRLMNFVENYSGENKIKRVYFETNKKSPAIRFYKKLGYKINKQRISLSKKLK
jgi:ribosomal protein S18 acetylase RimI-like enzyme